MKHEQENLFKGKFNRKILIEGTKDWFHDPSGEEMEIVEVKNETEKDIKKI